jgi:hypothetical protein
MICFHVEANEGPVGLYCVALISYSESEGTA